MLSLLIMGSRLVFALGQGLHFAEEGIFWLPLDPFAFRQHCALPCLSINAGGLGLDGALDQQAITVAALGGSSDFVSAVE